MLRGHIIEFSSYTHTCTWHMCVKSKVFIIKPSNRSFCLLLVSPRTFKTKPEFCEKFILNIISANTESLILPNLYFKDSILLRYIFVLMALWPGVCFNWTRGVCVTHLGMANGLITREWIPWITIYLITVGTRRHNHDSFFHWMGCLPFQMQTLNQLPQT